MKKNKVLKIVLIVLGALVALLAAAVLGVLFYLHSMASGIPETLPDAPSDSTRMMRSISCSAVRSRWRNWQMKPPRPAAGNRRHPPALRSRRQVRLPPRRILILLRRHLPPGRRAAVQRPPASRRLPVQPKPSSSSGKQEASYEAEVKALLKQLYSVKARAEAELNSCIAGAKAEFKSLPESQQTQARKISIVLARSGRLYAMQASYDREVESIVSQMRAILTANGQSTALADQAMASYKAQKSAMYSQLTAKLYS